MRLVASASVLLVSLYTTTDTTAAYSDISADITVSSNRLLRGFSLTDNNPSVIGGLHYQQKSGFYGHAVAITNVRVHNPYKRETLYDIFIGQKINAGIAVFDFGYVHHKFSKTGKADSGEWYIGTQIKNLSAHYYQNNNLKEKYYDLQTAYPMNRHVSVKAHIGKLETEDYSSQDFIDYSIGLVSNVKGFNLELTYAYNDNEESLKTIAGDHWVFSLQKSW